MFPEKEIGTLNIINLCKTPNSYGCLPGDSSSIKLPVCTVYTIENNSQLDTDYEFFMKMLSKEVFKINEALSEHYKGYVSWVLYKTIPPEFKLSIAEVDKRLENYNIT